MKTQQSLQPRPPRWFMITLALFIYIFCLTFVPWSNFLATKYYGGAYYFSLIGYFIPVVSNVVQYFAIVFFLFVATKILTQKRDRRTIVFLAIYGLVTLLFVILLSLLSAAIQPMIPGSVGRPENIDKWTLYATSISGLITIVLALGKGFYKQRSLGKASTY